MTTPTPTAHDTGFSPEVQKAILTHITPPWELFGTMAHAVYSVEGQLLDEKEGPYANVKGNVFTRGSRRSALFNERVAVLYDCLFPRDFVIDKNMPEFARRISHKELASIPSNDTLKNACIIEFNNLWITAGEEACSGSTDHEREHSFVAGVLKMTSAWIDKVSLSPEILETAALNQFVNWRMTDLGIHDEAALRYAALFEHFQAANPLNSFSFAGSAGIEVERLTVSQALRHSAQAKETLAREIRHNSARAYPGQPALEALFDERVGPQYADVMQIVKNGQGWFTGHGISKLTLAEVNYVGLKHLPPPLSHKIPQQAPYGYGLGAQS